MRIAISKNENSFEVECEDMEEFQTIMDTGLSGFELMCYALDLNTSLVQTVAPIANEVEKSLIRDKIKLQPKHDASSQQQ